MKRRIGLGLVALILAAGLLVLVGRNWIAQRAFDRAVDKSVGIDRSAALPDGLHAYVCGSGSPLPDAARAGPCIAVLAGRQAFVFDAGSGSIRKLGRMGFPMDRLQAAFLTHLHSDHIDGLGELMLQAWIAGGRSVPLPIYGPAGTDKVVNGFDAAYETDRDFRIAHHGPKVTRPGGFGGAAHVLTLDPGSDDRQIYASGDATVRVFRVNHDPVKPAFGYRIDYKGRSIAISGDTVYVPSLVKASRGVDVLFHEAMNKHMVAALQAKLAERGRADAAKIMGDIQSYHSSPEDAARAAREAGAKALVLYHLVPAPPARLIEPLFLGDAPNQFSGTLRLAQDGMIVSLPAGGADVRFSRAF
ncbi:MAG: MBL fold metallo-hydrolase [Sphingomonadales bacterium]|nr:MBL fold metallo-hydrolase [Sphingomonadales bacterium]